MASSDEQRILASWRKNAEPWSTAVEDQQIESRRLVTDQAIVDAVYATGARHILDIGCGEGWLARALSKQGCRVVGIDAVAALLDRAQALGGAEFHLLEYAAISSRTLADTFDLAVCNFSLLGEKSVEQVFRNVPRVLNKGGRLVVQTLHPAFSCGESCYTSGWREGSWAGFDDAFSDPAPWYFRTLSDWVGLFVRNGFSIEQIAEPVAAESRVPASLILVGQFIQQSR